MKKYLTKNFYDKQNLGIILGFLSPIITLLVVYLQRYLNISVSNFLQEIISLRIYTQILALCIVPNLLLFFIFIWKDALKAARGVLIITFFYAFLVFILKFFT